MRTRWLLPAGFVVLTAAAGCTERPVGDAATGGGGSGGSGTSEGGSGGSDTSAGGSGGGSASECSGLATHIERVVCAAEAFEATLSADEVSTAQLAWSDSVAKTRWSNLPGQERSGIAFGDLSATQRVAAMAVAQEVLSDAGYTDLVGVLAADDYLGTLQSGGGPGAAGYSSDNAHIAFIGVPSVSGDWMFQLGNHHMAWNVTYLGGVGFPTPAHLGVEPKAAFTLEGVSYEPMSAEGAALIAAFDALDASQLAEAFLSGQSFGDVLLGPDEYATGSYDAVVFPTGANRAGVVVSSLSAEQQALVIAAMEQWVGDYDPEVADALMDAYTSAEALDDTLIAWAGSEASGVDPDVNGTYLRIDGPRVWIEVDCQGGIVVQGATHYHSIFRDKSWDYGASL